MADSSRARRWLLLLLKIVVSAGLVTYLATRLDWDKMGARIAESEPVWFLMAVGVLVMAQLVSTIRWRLVAKSLGLGGTFGEYLRLYFLGMFYNLFLPTGFGGDVVKIYLLGKRQQASARVALSVLWERGIGLLALFILGAVAVLFVPGDSLPAGVPLLLIGLGVVAIAGYLAGPFLLPLFDRLPEKLARKMEVFRVFDYRKQPVEQAQFWALSFVVQVLGLAEIVALAQMLQLEAPAVLVISIFIVVTLLTLVPVSVNGIGVREASFSWFLVYAGYDPEGGTWLGILFFASHLVVGLPGLIPFVAGWRDRKELAEATPSV